MYYLLYADDCEVPSKVAFDPEEPSLGRIRADFVSPPHSPTSIKQCISRVEKTPAFAHADLFTDIMQYSIERRLHFDPSHWWARPESEWANGCKRKVTIAHMWVSILQLFNSSMDKFLSKWYIEQDTNGNISITQRVLSRSESSPRDWRLIPADGNSY